MTAHSTRKPLRRVGVRNKRRTLMWSSAAAAIAVAALQPRPAHAQAFVGTPATASGTVSYDRATPNIETITVNSATATVNWTPTGTPTPSGTLDFLPAGNTATFTNGVSVSDFTILNRIQTGTPIELNGHVISQLQSGSGTATGGHVWFYSPGGIIVGATAVFDVGGLLLTTNDPLTFSTTATGFTGNFVAGANSTAGVTIDPGAQINATPENSYVALVAPRVVQGGTVNVNGSAAYVGGEDVTLTMNQGLFDIAVNVGTSDPFNPDSGNGVVHTGTTGGPASTGAAGDNHRIYMVAVPKNQALTMLLSGNAGFQPASSINIRNGTIVLAAGSSIAETSGTLNIISPPNINADLTIGGGTYSSDVKGFARGDIDVTADSGFIHFLYNVTLTSLLAGETGMISFGASAGNLLNIEGNVTLQTNGATFSSGAPEEINLLVDGGTLRIGGALTIFGGAAADGTPNDVEISVRDSGANHGSMSVGGQTLIGTSASTPSGSPGGSLDSADEFAGDITIEALNGGSILFQSTVDLFASAAGQDNDGNGSGFNLGRAGDGFGGRITISASGGSMTFNNYLHADASGIGGRMLDGGLFGGFGFGGSVDMSVFDGGSIHVFGETSLTAFGIGGRFIGSGIPSSAQGGSGFGGQVTIWSSGTGLDPGSITLDGNTNLGADGTGGSGQAGGSGLGGRAEIYAYDGTIALGPTITVSAVGRGGNASSGFGGSGGGGRGGTALIEARAVPPGFESFPTQGTITGGSGTIDSSGFGGSGGAGDGGTIAAGAGGDGRGGRADPQTEQFGGAFAQALQSGGSLTLGDVTLRSDGNGGAGGTGGNGQVGGNGGSGFGGSVEAGISLDFYAPNATLGVASFGNMLGFASGTGGAGGSSLFEQGDGGSGFGGDAVFQALTSDATASSLGLFAQGSGGNGGLVGGGGFGGTVTVSTDGGHIDITNALTALTDSFAGSANAAGTGGDGFGGDVNLTVNGGRISFNGGQMASRGNGATGYTAGDGFGGTVTVSITDLGGLLAMNGDVLIAAFGGGDFGIDTPGGTGGIGGAGFGGDITISIPSSLVPDATAALEFGNLTVRALGVGGDGGGGLNGGAGGYGEGGTITFLLGAGGSIDGTTLTALANGSGGIGGSGGATGGSGGDASGGSTDINIVGMTTLGDIQTSAIGFGGDGGTGSSGNGGAGGNATGGSTTLSVEGPMNAASYDTSARAWGGIGGLGSVQGVGGWADGGNAFIEILAGGNADISGDYFGFTSSAFGGEGSVGGDAFGADGQIIVEGTLTVAGLVNAAAQGFAGNGTGGAGGIGTGGLAELIVDGGDFTAGSIFVAASATGGNGTTNGGDATGGDAAIRSINGATATITTSSLVQADGLAGSGVTGTGGAGIGGDASFKAKAGSALAGKDVTVSALGTGGAGANGGAGTGGMVRAGADDEGAQLTLTGLTTMVADAAGGAGATDGTGGNAIGGSAGIEAGVDEDAEIVGTIGGTTIVENALVTANGTGGAGGTGGSGTGGDAHAGTRYGSFTLTGTLTGQAIGTGGKAFDGVGGTGTGGYFLIAANFTGDTAAGMTDIATANISADGIGGMGGNAFGAGGDGTGGTVEILGSTAYGTLNIDALTASANGLGGQGGDNEGLNGGLGGTGQGGVALLESQNFEGVPGIGGVTIGSATLAANGSGGAAGQGTGGTAGQGIGGDAHANADHSPLTANSLTIHADGSDSGGLAQVQFTDSTVDLGDLSLTAIGNFGGVVELNLFGSTLSADSVTLTANGVASAGSATLSVATNPSGTGSTLTTGAFTASADGGDNGDIFVSVDNGSSADLGVAQLSALGPGGGGEIHEIAISIGGSPIVVGGGLIGTLDLTNTVLSADSLSLVSGGTIDIASLNGASIDIAGTFSANAAGAMTLDDVDGTAVVRADIIDFDANSFSSTFDILGRVVDIFSVLDLDVTDTVLDADETLTLTSNADILAGDLDAGLLISLNAGRDITAGDLDSGGDVFADAIRNITLDDITATGRVDLESDGTGGVGDIKFGNVTADRLSFSADGTVTGEDIQAVTRVDGDAEGAIVLGDITVGPGPETNDDFSVGIASETSIDVGDVVSFGRVGFATLGDLTTGNITAGPVFLTMVGGDVDVGSITTATDGRVYMADVSMFLAAGGPDDFNPSQVLNAAPVPTGGSIFIDGPVSTGRFQAAAGVDFDSAAIAAGQSIEIGAGNDLFTGDLDAGTTVDLSAGNNLAVFDVDAGTSATFAAGGIASFLGIVSAPTITVTSWDIDIDGQLGVQGVTDLVTLNAISADTPILIGGEDEGGATALAEGLQYWLADNEEIQGDTIVFNAVAGGQGPTPDVIVSDFEIEGTLTDGGGVHHAQLNTDGSVKIEGTLLYTAAGGTDLLDINAGDIQVNTSTGGRIAMTNVAEDAPAGILELNADDIWVGSQSLLDSLNGDVNFAGRDGVVGTNPGAVVPEGWLIADAMTLSVGNTLFVQNSGAGRDYAGITVGAGGLHVRTTGAAPAQVVAYGRKFNPDGTFVTGNAFFKLVDFGFTQGSTYTRLAEFNECLINSGCTVAGGGGPLGPESILGPVDLMGDPQETTEGLGFGDDFGTDGGIDGGIDGGTDGGSDDGGDSAGGSESAQSQLINSSALSSEELIDEGVTSAGDNNRWCDDDQSNSNTEDRCK